MVPTNAVQVTGQGVVSADNLNTFIQVVANYAAMRSFTGVANMVVCSLGTSTPNDGGQAHFYWNPTSAAADNNSTAIVPFGSTAGAWLRLTGI